MRLLLDESLPRRLKYELTGHEAMTVPEMGWAGKSNGELLLLASDAFDAFVTADQNLQYQQNLRETDIPIFVLAAQTSRIEHFRPLIPELLRYLNQAFSAGVTVVQG